MDDYEKARKLVREFIEQSEEGRSGCDGTIAEVLEALAVMEDFIKTPPGHYKLFFGEYYVSGKNYGCVSAWYKGQKMDGAISMKFSHCYLPEEQSAPTRLDIKIDGYNM